jgi:PadR family transcriptional regulator, regulatory protein PadR
MGEFDRIGELERIVLIALLRRNGQAYGMEIRREIAVQTDRDISIGAVYTVLNRLQKKGWSRKTLFSSECRGASCFERLT